MSESPTISTNTPINRRPIQIPVPSVRTPMASMTGQYKPIQLPSSAPVFPKRTPIQLSPSSPVLPKRTPIQLPPELKRTPIQLPINSGQYRPIQLPPSVAPIQTVKKIEKDGTDWLYYLSIFLILLILILLGYILWQVFFAPQNQEVKVIIQDQVKSDKEEQIRKEKQMLEDQLAQEKLKNEEMKVNQEIQEQKKEPEKMNFDIVYDSPKYKDNNNSMKYMMDSDELGNVFLGFWEDLNKRWTAELINNKEGKYYIKYDDKCLMLNDSNNVALKDYSKEMEDYMTWNLVPFKEELKKNYSNENDLYFIDNNINTPSNVLYNEKTKSYLSVNNSGDIVGVIYPNSDTLLKTE